MNALAYTCELVRMDSVRLRSSVPITDTVEGTLARLGFVTERIDYVDAKGGAKSNVVSKKGTGSDGMAYFAHTDAVRADQWAIAAHGPFDPRVWDGRQRAEVASSDAASSWREVASVTGPMPRKRALRRMHAVLRERRVPRVASLISLAMME